MDFGQQNHPQILENKWLKGRYDSCTNALRLTKMPAVLVECEFLTNPQQLEFLAHPDNQERLAAAVAEGVAAVSR